MKNTDDVNHKATRIRFAMGVLLFLTFALTACFSMDGQEPDMSARATWTPVAQPTDQPYQVEAKVPPYFGETPAVVIFGSQDPNDDSPLQAINLSTEDDYDVAALTPGPISTWSRPIMAEDNTLFFQIGPKLYKLLPGGGAASVDLPFDENDPVFCNWSWKGQIVCLNGLMTEGYLVDQDLNLKCRCQPIHPLTLRLRSMRLTAWGKTPCASSRPKQARLGGSSLFITGIWLWTP